MSLVPNAETRAVPFLGFTLGTPPARGRALHGPTDRFRCPIVAELGINHNGDEAVAHAMIDAAAACGVNIVKLQKRQLDATYDRRYIEDPGSAPGSLANYLPVLAKCELPDEAYPRLKAHAEEKGLGFLVTPFDLPSVAFLERIGVEAYKVASCDATNPLLLAAIAGTGKPFVVSTGMTREVQVFQINDYLSRLAPGRFAYMHSVSGYPVAFADCQLHMILRYKVGLRTPVGWSGHESGVAVSVGAVAAGADLLERHFTLDRSLRGPDHAASLEPDGLKKLVARVRAFEAAYGDPYMPGKGLTRGETVTQEVLGKSLFAKRSLALGEEFGWEDVEARSPGRGVSPLCLLAGQTWRAPRALAAGEPLTAPDLALVLTEAAVPW